MAEETPPKETTTLCLETIKEILTRLPVKSLIRFESVSKPFLFMIKSPEFISSHLSFSSSRNPMILLRRFHNPTGSNFSISSLDTNTSVLRDIRVPFLNSLIRFPKIVGSSSGLLCVDISPCYATCFVLWNVSTCSFRGLPRPGIVDNQLPFWMVSSGFGYDPVADDFFLVRVVSFQPDSALGETELHDVRAEVYSWRSDCWKVIDRSLTDPKLVGCSIGEGQNGVCVNGSINWVANGMGKWVNRKFLISYEMGGSGEFRRTLIPDYHGDVCVKVLGFKGCVALAFYPAVPVYPHGAGRAGDRMELWVLDECGWVKLFSIPASCGMPPGCPVGIWNDCELIVKRQEAQFVTLSFIDPRKQSFRRFPVCPAEFSCEVYKYIESLVPVVGFRDQDLG